MTEEERKLALHCLKANNGYHSEVCEECVKYPNCDHMIQDDVTETIIKALEHEPCEDCVRRQEVLDILKDKWNMFSDANDAMQESINAIKALQPVTPQSETVTDFADRCRECGAKYGKLLKQEETHNIIEKGVLKQRGEDYVYYDINWLKKWWRQEMEILGINTWE